MVIKNIISKLRKVDAEALVRVLKSGMINSPYATEKQKLATRKLRITNNGKVKGYSVGFLTKRHRF